MKFKRGIIPIAIIGALLVSLFAPMAVSADSPVLPTSFYGDVTVNDIAVPVDTIITGRIVDAVGSPGEGTITVTEEGKYGVSGLGSKLSVTTDSLDDVDKEIEFYVKLPDWTEAQKADPSPTATYDSATHQVNLNVVMADEVPPTVVSTTPEAEAPSVSIDLVVSAIFSEDIQAGANFGDIAISGADGVSASIDGATLTIAHDAFAYETSYTVTIPAGAVKDLADLPLAEAKVWSFTVVTEEEAEFDPYTYDTDEDGEFSKDETLAAVNDYLASNITKNQVLEVVKLYFS